MNQSTTKTTRHFTGYASLAAIGVKLRQLDVFGPIRQTLRIAQKTVKHTPIDKVYDAFISRLPKTMGWSRSIVACVATPPCRQSSDPALC